MKRPVLVPLLAYLIAILTLERLDLRPSIVGVFFILSLLLFLLRSRSLYFFTCLIFLAGLSIYQGPLRQEDMIEGNFEVVGLNYGSYKTTYQIRKKRKKYLFRSKKMYALGDQVYIRASLERPKSQDNFHLFSYRKHLKSKRIFYQLKVFEEEALNKKSLRGRANRILIKNLSAIGDEPRRELMKKLVLGQGQMDQKDLKKYRDIGLAHILSISGLHINIFIVLLEGVFERLGLKKKLATSLIGLGLFLYGYLIYFPISLQRALIMYGLRELAIYRKNIYDRLNSLYLAGFIILLINPYAIYSQALYLSFASIFSLIYFREKLKLALPWIKNKYLLSYLALQLGLMPLQIYYFDSYNLASFFSNLIILPIFEIFIGLSLFFVFGRPLLGGLLDPLLTGLFILVEGLSSFIYRLDFLSLRFDSFNFFDLVLAYGLIFLFLNHKRLRRLDYSHKKLFFQLTLLVFSFSTYLFYSHPLVFINMVDVGQGDCILYRDRYENILFDLGGNPMAKERSGEDLIKYLKKNKVKKLDKVFISHLDFDHMGNLYQILGQIPIDKIYIGQDELLDLEGQDIINLSKDEILDLGQARLTTILEGAGEKRTNDTSLVLDLEVFSTHLLLTGDIEENEKLIGDKIKSTDILKVSHHGSAHSTKDYFLDKIAIKDALISVGQGNSYGHPSKEVVERLEKRSIKTYRTDLDGNILIIISPTGYRIFPHNHL